MTQTDVPVAPVDVLTEDECWAALESTDFGRLAVRDGEDVDIFPINYVVTDRLVYFRSAPGAKMIDLTRAPRVAFEADGATATQRWSVVIKGDAERLTFDTEIEESGVARLRSDAPSTKWNYVRITPVDITGRSFERAR
jgi:nitroimidazol reductase NimA-like FMN-containing flavoprotein (pyridoxamine 5'-phosphate oxidase superfamily)